MLDTMQQMEVFPTTVDLKRIDPSLNMRRFYRMSVQPDLFGGACLVREWGRIGFRGQMMIEQHPDEGRAVSALMKLAVTKTRRGYRASVDQREQRVSGVPSLTPSLPPAKTNVKSRAYGLKGYRKSAKKVEKSGPNEHL
jgi:predicted DNA-binding WGR domain protein